MSDRNAIVVGVDGSPGSLAALRWALGLAARTGATVEVVTAYLLQVAGPPGARFPVEPEDEVAARTREIQDDALERSDADSRDVDLTRTVVHGHGAKVLLEVADGRHLVVGSRGLGGFGGLLLGSVSQQCVTHATGPVTVIPPPDAAPEAPRR